METITFNYKWHEIYEMETITFNYKTKVEQFKEQFPGLYAEIYQLGYMDATKAMLTDDDHYEDSYDDYGDDTPF